MTANNNTDFINYLVDVATERHVPATERHVPATQRQNPATIPPLNLDDTTPAAFIMDVLHHIGTHPFLITRHGVDDMMDILLTHPALYSTLVHASDIQEHFAVTFLRRTNAVFQDHWTYIIVPAWNQLAYGATAQ
jgi:hypothetical protein